MISTTIRLACAAITCLGSTIASAGSGPTIPINYGHTGTYYELDKIGQGMLMEVVPDTTTMVVSWFTYLGEQEPAPAPGGAPASAATQRWYFAQGVYAEGDHVVQLEILQPIGGRFATSGAADFPLVGNAQLSFDSCDSGELAYTFSATGVSGQIPLTRLFADGICQQFLAQMPAMEDAQ